MTLPTGTLNFSQLQTEFGGTNPISLSEYYRGGARVGSSTTSAYGTIPTSGAISLGVFRGTNSFYYSNIPNTSKSSTYTVAYIKHNSNGTVTIGGNDDGDSVYNWYSPTTIGIGSSHWIRITKTSGSGTLSGITNATWTSAATAITCNLSAAAGQTRSWTGTVEYSTSSGGPIVSTSGVGGITLIVDYL